MGYGDLFLGPRSAQFCFKLAPWSGRFPLIAAALPVLRYRRGGGTSDAPEAATNLLPEALTLIEPYPKGSLAVSDLAKRRSTMPCPRCKAAMDEVVRIEPLQNDPGLIGYECPLCCYVTSVFFRVAKGN